MYVHVVMTPAGVYKHQEAWQTNLQFPGDCLRGGVLCHTAWYRQGWITLWKHFQNWEGGDVSTNKRGDYFQTMGMENVRVVQITRESLLTEDTLGIRYN